MATVNKKKPAKNPVIKFSSEDDHDKVLLCGKSGTGKTTFACTYPNPFVLDFDKGLATVRNKNIPRIKFIRMTGDNKNSKGIGEDGSIVCSYKNVLATIRDFIYREGEIWEAIADQDIKVETLILDSLTSLSDLFESEIVVRDEGSKVPRNGSLQLQDYNLIQRRLFSVIDILRELDYNFICTAGIQIDKDEQTGRFLEDPMMTGSKLGPRIPYLFDEVYLHTYDEKANKWYVTGTQTRTFNHAKSRTGLPYGEKFENPTYDKLRKVKK